MSRSQRFFLLSGIFTGLFILLIILVKNVNVRPDGPMESMIGLASLNNGVHNFFGTNYFLYKITEGLGYFSIALALGFVVVGIVQMIKRRSFYKVDRHIRYLGLIYAFLVGVYILFEKLIINYRPVIMQGEEELEASFPSSHTMLTFVILGTAIVVLSKYSFPRAFSLTVKIIFIVLICMMVLFRLMSGVHWFTDIIGGVLIAVALIKLYLGFISVRPRRYR